MKNTIAILLLLVLPITAQSFDEKIEELEKTLQKLQDQIDTTEKLDEENKVVKQKLGEKDKQIEQLKKENTELKKKYVEEQQKQIEKLQTTEDKSLSERVSLLEQENQMLKSRRATLHIKAGSNWNFTIKESAYSEINGLNVTVNTECPSLLIMTFSAHCLGSDTVNSGLNICFFVNDQSILPPSSEHPNQNVFSGVSVTHRNSIGGDGGWQAVSLTQMHEVESGKHTVSLKARVYGASWGFNGSAIQVAVVPK